MKNFFLKIAGFTIKITVEAGDHQRLRELFCQQIENVWGRGKFLEEKQKNSDLTIRVLSTENQARLIKKPASGETYLLSFKKNAKGYLAYYHTSFWALELLLKEVLDTLLKKEGFILHASGVITSKGKLHIFLAERGGGKSTVVKLLENPRVLRFCDDNLIVRKIKGRFLFFSPPFIEKDLMPQRRFSRSAKVYFVRKSYTFFLEKFENKTKIVRKLLKSVWSRSGDFEKERLGRLIDFATANDFYLLGSVLNKKEMRRVIGEN